MHAFQTGNCGCARPMVTLTGTVSSATGPVANALLRYTAGGISATIYADAQGRYSLPVAQGSQVIITPEAGLGVTVTPPSRTISPACADQSGLNFVFTPLTPPGGTFTVSGTLSGQPGISGTVNYTINGVAGSVATDTLGNYSFTAPAGAAVVITPPTIAGLTPTPATRTLTNLAANAPGQNFVYTASAGLTVSGTLTGVPGNVPVTVNYLINGVPGSTTSNPVSGAYSFAVPSGAAVAILPSAVSGFTPAPLTRTLTNVTTNMPGQNFAYEPDALNISGLLTGPLGALSGIELLYSVNGVLHTTDSDAAGNFTLQAQPGDNVAIELVPPPGFMVSPAAIVLNNVQTNLPNQNFTLSINPQTTALISGTLSGAIDPVFQPVTARINGGAPIILLTNHAGQYVLPVTLGASVVIEPPVILGRTATPPSYTLPNVTADMPNRNFVYTA